MEGGIRAWNGLIASGPPEAGMARFMDAMAFEERVALAWVLEQGARRFYAGVAEQFGGDGEIRRVFGSLVTAEEHHMQSLATLLADLNGEELTDDYPVKFLPGDYEPGVMEGGIEVEKALDWASGKDINEILELSVSLEANSYDLYIKLQRTLEDERSRKVFDALVREEKGHLERLTALLEQRA